MNSKSWKRYNDEIVVSKTFHETCTFHKQPEFNDSFD